MLFICNVRGGKLHCIFPCMEILGQALNIVKRGCQFFLFAPKDPLDELFSKIKSKVPASFYFGKKYESSKSAETYLICIISIGLSVHFHNARISYEFCHISDNHNIEGIPMYIE